MLCLWAADLPFPSGVTGDDCGLHVYGRHLHGSGHVWVILIVLHGRCKKAATMAPTSDDGSRIVATYPGHLTGETIYRDASGQNWTTEIPKQPVTGQTIARVVNGRIQR